MRCNFAKRRNIARALQSESERKDLTGKRTTGIPTASSSARRRPTSRKQPTCGLKRERLICLASFAKSRSHPPMLSSRTINRSGQGSLSDRSCDMFELGCGSSACTLISEPVFEDVEIPKLQWCPSPLRGGFELAQNSGRTDPALSFQ